MNHFDPAVLRVISGWRDGEVLLHSVPNVSHFQTVLRAIKLWAKRTLKRNLLSPLSLISNIGRGLYSNAMGFLGGFSWSVLAANLCKHAKLSTADGADGEGGLSPEERLLAEFFETYSNWDWWEQIVAITPASARYKRSAKVILLSSPAVVSLMLNSSGC